MRPPENPSSGDTFGYLYRTDSAARPVTASPVVAESGRTTESLRAAISSRPGPESRSEQRPGLSPGSSPRPTPVHMPPLAEPVKQEREIDILAVGRQSSPTSRPYSDPQAPSRRGRRALLVAVLLLIAIGVGAGAVWLLDRSRSDPEASPTTSTDAASGPYQGEVVPLPVSAVTADCAAADRHDDAGQVVHYGPEGSVDDDPATAWRCPGSGKGKSLFFEFPEGSRIAELGVVNGYVKRDPKSQKDRYGEYRRITRVTWTFPDGTNYEQQLVDGRKELQSLRIPPTQSNRVTLTIESVTKPGGNAESRDAILISQASFATPQ